MIGRTLGHYRIDEEIGRGGMGVVYKAHDLRLGRTVALKFLSPDLTRDSGAKERFLSEARAVSALDHPNVCTLHEIAETEDGRTYLVLAYYPGETLARKIERGPLPVEQALDLALQVARALSRAHESGILHRDVKPANVVVTERGEAKVLDFGVAKLSEATRRTLTGDSLGTPAYMSPEAIRGEKVDARSDLWSLGVLLYECLAGAPPFGAGGPQTAMYAILNEPPAPLAKLRSDLPDGLVELVSRLLEKERNQRPPSAEAVVRALEAILRGAAPVRGARPSGSRARRVLPAAAAVVVLVAVLLVARRLRGEGTRPSESAGVPGSTSVSATIAVLPFAVRGGTEFAYLGDGLVDLLGTKLDGAGDLRSVDAHALLSFVEREAGDARSSREAAEKVAAHFGAGLFLQGDVLEAGRRLHVSASLYSAGKREPVGRATVEGDAERIFELVDDLVTGLLAERFSGVAGRVTRMAAATTHSLPALKAYLQGEEQFRSGRFTDALASFERAVEVDPEFALAWYRISVAAEWATRQDKTEVAAQRALALADRLSEHDRRLLEARLANRRGDAVESERLYRTILAQFPDDVEAWSQLAEVQFHYGPMRGRSVSESRAAWERVLFFEPSLVESLWHVARIAASEGKKAEVDQLVKRVLALNPEGERALELEALRAFALDDAQAESDVLDRLSRASENVVALADWNVAAFSGNLPGARRVIELNTGPGRVDDARAMAHVVLAYLALAEGKWGRTQAELDAAAALRPGWTIEHRAFLATFPFVPTERTELERLRSALESWDAAAEPPGVIPTTFFAGADKFHAAVRLHLLGLLEAQLGLASARERAAELERSSAPAEAPFLMTDLAAEVRARIAWEAGDRSEALRELDGTRRQVLYQAGISSPFGAQAYGRFAHAEALAAAGREAEALVLFSSFAQVSNYELAFDAPARFARARIHEARGEREAAAADYRAFLGRWSGADEIFQPRVGEARARLEVLGK